MSYACLRTNYCTKFVHWLFPQLQLQLHKYTSTTADLIEKDREVIRVARQSISDLRRTIEEREGSLNMLSAALYSTVSQIDANPDMHVIRTTFESKVKAEVEAAAKIKAEADAAKKQAGAAAGKREKRAKDRGDKPEYLGSLFGDGEGSEEEKVPTRRRKGGNQVHFKAGPIITTKDVAKQVKSALFKIKYPDGRCAPMNPNWNDDVHENFLWKLLNGYPESFVTQVIANLSPEWRTTQQ